MEKEKIKLAVYHAFASCLAIGPVRFSRLMAAFNNRVVEAYQARDSRLKPILGIKIFDQFNHFRHHFSLLIELRKVGAKQISILPQEDDRYPRLLKEIADPPICLYVKGKKEDLNLLNQPALAVVGARRASIYGRKIAASFTTELSRQGVVIISGMARGIDKVAHQSALKKGGKTIAILGCGVDVVYPLENRLLYQKIINGGGLVVSEFPPGQRTAKKLFVLRNRLISGMAKSVLIVEGTNHSGTLITAKFAAAQGRDVFVPNYKENLPLSFVPHFLAGEGASVVKSPAELVSAISRLY